MDVLSIIHPPPDPPGPIWGLDHEGELRGVYRPSGHPGVSIIADSVDDFGDSTQQTQALVRSRGIPHFKGPSEATGSADQGRTVRIVGIVN
ncbi:FAD/NAD-binding domain-containing protein [Mycena sanguinolenta]|uniref:FAD/NAD-binding domain-containing protein n=1 Tax=Mycena sanguinolenta TaxID=230812 RepID=A0A8H6YGC5_9AGAR|nr:FAD/NAD-binding domain-containing protein [Mycena sanguinolenta]